MDEKQYIDLMHREIDGLNAPEESKKLKEYLEKNSEAQELFNQFVSISNKLGEVEEITPPPDLKPNIMHAISGSAYQPKKQGNALKSLLNSLRLRFNYRYAYAFSFGLIAGIILYSMYVKTLNTGVSSDISDLYGTLIFNTQPEALHKGDDIHIDLEEVQGTIGVKYYKNTIIAEIILESRNRIEVNIQYDENDLYMSGFFQSRNASSLVKMNDTHLRMTHLGENTYVVAFTNRAKTVTSLNVQILSSGTEIYSKAISTEISVD